MKAVLNPKTNIIDDPIHPCYKAPDKGLCQMRVYPESEGIKFECANDPEWCKYLKKAKAEWLHKGMI